MKPIKFYHVVPFMPVRDLQETLAYYKDQLGFYGEWVWKESDAGIKRDTLHLLFNHAPEYTNVVNTPRQHFEIMWFVDNVKGIYDEYKEKNVNIVSELEDKPWGVKEFTVEDINGYYLRIAEGSESANENNEL